eukprot:TRINITY_DN4992_c0_g2_i1.p1 TRINITY_DN4992_c0_g2~~TRINITY_DN4992_c0_g2_i1.p1  ORF type:complete len:727 (+),score=104.61 TRINITY_DN4992_c0_g2_i1:54-2234(+)
MARIYSDLSQIEFNATLSVSENEDLELGCGGRTLPTPCFYQTGPLLPLQDPIPLPHLPAQDPPLSSNSTSEEAKAPPPLVKRPLDNSKMDVCRVEPCNKGILNKKQFSRMTKKFVNDEDGRNTLIVELKDDVRRETNILPVQCYGLENMFNKSCVRIVDDFIFYTGNDGLLRISKFSGDTEELNNIDAIVSDKKFDHTRIYSLDVRSVGDECYLIAARYRFGISYWSFDGKTCSPVASFAQSGGSIAHCYLNDSQSLLLDTNSRLSLCDINTGKLKMRKYVNCGVKNYSWGTLSQGRNLNSICVASRKNVRLFDVRSDNLETICDLEEKMYLRDVNTNLPYIYLTTDESIQIFDLRNTKHRIRCVDVNFCPHSIVQGSEVMNMDGQHWCLTSTNKGELSVTVLDYSHKSCANFVPVDKDVLLTCNRGPKLPDVLGGGSVMLKGWKDAVARARINAGVWLEHSLENRFNVEFRGGALHKYDENIVRAVTVNGVGDLFYTDLKTVDVNDDFDNVDTQDDVTRAFRFQRSHDEILESWGQKVYDNTPIKKVLVRRMCYDDSLNKKAKRCRRDGLPKINRDRVGNVGVEHLDLCKEYVNSNIALTIPDIKSIDYSKYPENSISRNILNILMPADEDTRSTTTGSETDHLTDVESEESASVAPTLPPTASSQQQGGGDDAQFLLLSYLNDLGVDLEQPVDINNMSSYMAAGAGGGTGGDLDGGGGFMFPED